MNNPYSYDSYAYRTPVAPRMTRYPYGYPKNTTVQPSSGEASKTVIFVVLGILIVGIVIWIIVNFLLYKDDKAWFKVYKAPPPPSDAVQPNGDGTGGSLDPAVTTYRNQQLSGYQALNPSTTPSEFGGYITTPS